jgi:hypothetical protein
MLELGKKLRHRLRGMGKQSAPIDVLSWADRHTILYAWFSMARAVPVQQATLVAIIMLC